MKYFCSVFGAIKYFCSVFGCSRSDSIVPLFVGHQFSLVVVGIVLQRENDKTFQKIEWTLGLGPSAETRASKCLFTLPPDFIYSLSKAGPLNEMVVPNMEKKNLNQQIQRILLLCLCSVTQYVKLTFSSIQNFLGETG